MSKPSVSFNDYVSLAVMLLMVVALVAGQADARGIAAERPIVAAPALLMDERLNIAFDGRIGEHDVELTLSVVSDSTSFRGEDE